MYGEWDLAIIMIFWTLHAMVNFLLFYGLLTIIRVLFIIIGMRYG